MTDRPDERAYLTIIVDGVPCAEVLVFESRESAESARDAMFEEMNQTEHAMVTIADDFGTEITVQIEGIRLIRLVCLTGEAP